MSYQKIDDNGFKVMYACVGKHKILNKFSIIFGICDYCRYTFECYDRMKIFEKITSEFEEFEIFYDLLVFKQIDVHDAEIQLKMCAETCESHGLIMYNTNFYYVPDSIILASLTNLFHEILTSTCSDQKKINAYMKVLLRRLY